MSKLIIPVILLIVVVIAAGYYAYTHSSLIRSYTSKIYNYTYPSSYSSYPLAITDPLQVPPNTSSVILYYSGINLETSKGNFTYSVSGSLNLINLVNLTQIITNLSLPANLTIKNVILNLTKATITINQVTYPIEIPPSVNFPVNQALSKNGSIVLDILPSVTPLYGSNSTIYVLIPSGVGVILNSKISNGILPTSVKDRIEELRGNISVVNSTLKVSGNATSFILYVKNNGNVSVNLFHVLLKGPFEMMIGKKAILPKPQEVSDEERLLNSTVNEIEREGNDSNLSNDPAGHFSGLFNFTFNSSVISNLSNALGFNVSTSMPIQIRHINLSNLTQISKLLSLKYNLEKRLERINELLSEFSKYSVVNFFVLSNGSLRIPFTGSFKIEDLEIPNSSLVNFTCSIESEDNNYVPSCVNNSFIKFGYDLLPGQVVKLSFNGIITQGGGIITLVPINGTYKLFVQGDRDAHASSEFNYTI
ncbi:MAG: hypothetical protein OH340_01565 [Candidatus Parvarchaeota archaeon]|nr:hypothetical protein [Candidatus Rehaiarchaeum fermentans]